jgi:imidazolonepropionase-like amidohydrolase
MVNAPRHRTDAVPLRTALENVRVFDGRRLLDPGTVVIDGGLIGTDATGARVVDCGGATLLPGLIDTHVHLRDVATLEQLTDFGVTTALDMGTWPPSLFDALRGRPGLTDILGSGAPAIASGGTHTRMPGFPADAVVTSPGDAARFVADRVAEGADHIKIIVENPGPHSLDAPTLSALVTAAREHGRLTVAHTSGCGAVDLAVGAAVDVITHVPMEAALDQAVANRIADAGIVTVPTLTMMASIVDQRGLPSVAYDNARAGVAALYRAGVPVLAGTDANASPGAPATVSYGESIHRELELLVAAGLSTVDALRAATVLPARYFGLPDRGAVEPGLRADLVLVAGDPVTDISATRRIERIWCGGTERRPDRAGE